MFSGLELREELYRTAAQVVRRARGSQAQASWLVRLPLRQPPDPDDLIELEAEYRRLAGLAVAQIPRPVELIRRDGLAALLLEDIGGRPLADVLRLGPLPLDSSLAIAVDLATALGALHGRNLTHRFLDPTVVVWAANAGRSQIIDLGQEGLTRGRGTPIESQPAIALRYISPEQSGRMNRDLDYRSDFYSLGVILYQLLAGRVPFPFDDPLELIHCHIARAPTALGDLDRAVPPALEVVVGKLLEKNAEQRYQSARGIIADLTLCLEQWRASGRIDPFAPGRHDVPERFSVVQKLYGRESELDRLIRAFERTAAGRPGVMLVCGPPGVGKTALIRELYKPITATRGYLLTGKVDQLARTVPYAPIVEAIRSLVQLLLTEDDARLDRIRTALDNELGPTVGVLCEVVPELELIVGARPASPAVTPLEAQNRLTLVFQRFLSVIADPTRPLAVFLDDLQWIDDATLRLLPDLLGSPLIRGLFVIGAYRDNEVGAEHPLLATVAELRRRGCAVESLRLGALRIGELARLVGDTLQRPADACGSLVETIESKTAGNPFFAIQLLRSLHQRGVIVVDPDHAWWSYDESALASLPISDNVVELMAQRIGDMPVETRELLSLGACIGASFDLPTLAVVSRRPVDRIVDRLRPALDAGLILAAGTPAGRFRFLHDRVQLAAYGLIPEDRRAPTHVTIGRLLLAGSGGRRSGGRLFDIVSHLNIGRRLLDDPAERVELARLNLDVGRAAKASAAFAESRSYLLSADELLDAAHWEWDYPLAFEVHRELAEAEYLCGDFGAAEALADELMRRAADDLDRARVHELRVALFENMSRPPQAIAAGRDGLALLDSRIPETDEAKRETLASELDRIRFGLQGRAIAALVELPEVRDERIRLVMQFLTRLWAPVYVSGDLVLCNLLSARLVSLSLEHGNSSQSAYGYVTHAITVGPGHGNYGAAYEWGLLALAVNERFGDRQLRAKIQQQFGAHVNLWRAPFASCLDHAREAYRAGVEVGDLAYASYGILVESWYAFLTGPDLEQFERRTRESVGTLEGLHMAGIAELEQAIAHWARALRGATFDPTRLSSPDFDAGAFASGHAATPFFMAILELMELQLAYTFGQYERAERVAASVEPRLAAVEGTVWIPLHDLYCGLALARMAGSDPAADPQRLDRAQGLARRLGRLAEHCPPNFRAPALLVEAELARVTGRDGQALRCYEEAIDAASRGGVLMFQALAHELYAGYWIDRGNPRIAGIYLRDAHEQYRRWGAVAKLRELERRHGELLAGPDGSRLGGTGRTLPIDLASTIKSARALTADILTDDYFERLVRIVIENAGAGRGLLLCEQDGTLTVKAEATLAERPVEPSGVDSAAAERRLPSSIAQYVWKTGKVVLLRNAAEDHRFVGDPYIAAHNPRSVLCLPLVHQGRRCGLLYLENNVATDAFGPERLAVMEVLAAQAAVSLEVARLYGEMKAEVSHRRSVEQSLRHAVDELERLKRRLQADNVYLQEQIQQANSFDTIIGGSPELRRCLNQVELVAPTDATVLILGETGTGKELVARAIHDRGPRRERPLVKVDCSSISAGLVESELFGHVRGAFTGAHDHRTGRFQLADGGTIFLDEIGELAPETQVKLLRVLQEREFEPVGSNKTVRVDVRVIAATSRDLPSEIAAGRFRQDLFYRLNVFPVDLPPLRARRRDIPELVTHFLARAGRRYGKPVSGISEQALDLLVGYDWPGNVRELQNVVERATVVCRGDRLEPESILLPGRAAAAATAPVTVAPVPSAGHDHRAASLEELERTHITSVLRRTGGVIEGPRGAARILDLSPSTTRFKMKKLGIRRSDFSPTPEGRS
ncbi:MAG TPA: sigma 54-interacting transcriptional regulator [Candidatus Polarisedimenticolaceae bacterium]|nr:sigma 54-interacting transcriptional regulator [Candidatus Polarisedimenticolaceae bacterium]